MSITQKILDIRKSLVVEKTGYDERGDYHYFRADDVANAVRDAMNEAGVIHRTTITNLREDNFYDTNGRNRPRVTFQATVTFIDVEDGSEFATDVVATGSDTGGDKGPRKAAVQAFKIAAIDVFTITEEMDRFDSDGDKEAEPANVTPTKREIADQNSASVAELTEKIKNIVTSGGPITGADVNTVGQRIAGEMGIDPKEGDKAWRKRADVLERLVAALEAGEVA